MICFLDKKNTFSYNQLLFSWPGSNCIRFDFKNHTGHASEIRQKLLFAGRQELKVSQQVCREEKHLHFGHRLSQTQTCPASKRNQGTDGPSTTFQKAFCNKSHWLSQSVSTALCIEVQIKRTPILDFLPGLKLYGSFQTSGSWWAPYRLGMIIVFLGMKYPAILNMWLG